MAYGGFSADIRDIESSEPEESARDAPSHPKDSESFSISLSLSLYFSLSLSRDSNVYSFAAAHRPVSQGTTGDYYCHAHSHTLPITYSI